MSNSVWTHRWQPTRFPRPWDSPGKNTGVGCHFLLQCMKVKSESEVAQSCLTLSDPMDCSLPDSSVRGIFQARVLEWGAIALSICIIEKISKEDILYKHLWKQSSYMKRKDFQSLYSYIVTSHIFHKLSLKKMRETQNSHSVILYKVKSRASVLI